MRVDLATELGPEFDGQWVELKDSPRRGGDILDARKAYRESPEEGTAYIIASRVGAWSREVPVTPSAIRDLPAPLFLLLEEMTFEQLARTERSADDTKDSRSSSSAPSTPEPSMTSSST